MIRLLAGCLLLAVVAARSPGGAEELSLPPRPTTAPAGTAFARTLTGLPLAERERRIVHEVKAGNVPGFWRRFVAVDMPLTVKGKPGVLRFFAAPDYLAVGSEADFFLAPLSPDAANALAAALGCTLPTPRMVDAIFDAAALKLPPRPQPPGPDMTTIPAFLRHHEVCLHQRQESLKKHPLGQLTSGHKKDVVSLPPALARPGKVAIYGWHRAVGNPIQPLFLGHAATWVDYSHGIRLVKTEALLDGRPVRLPELLKNATLAPQFAGGTAPSATTAEPDEELSFLHLDAGVRAALLRPDAAHCDASKPVLLVVYAVPNGNTVEQTLGRKLLPGDDWHFDIQHVAAQTRWLRSRLTGVNLAVACLECEGKSWPAWRRKWNSEKRLIPALLEALQKPFAGSQVQLCLASHSGGGAFVFGYLDSVQNIPPSIIRIAFLDSNYAYSASKHHAEKLAAWLATPQHPHLCVLAYHDSIATLNGKPFVSEAGGTWGRSHAMQQDLAASFPFTRREVGHWETFQALDGRVLFLLHKNPDKAILHTRLVEWNGFIHGLLSGTPLAEKDYQMGGPRVYDSRISAAPSQ
ncbi:MAG: hypothetical protein KA004_17455 [Verrucomicrobiales bacterium]|nr:hypothetical protein [Verrucomicrobiales bacterium]